MTRPRHFLPTVFLLILLALLSGCAAGPQQQSGQYANLSRTMQKALTAVENEKYEQAVKNFSKELKRDEAFPDEQRYHYGLALSKTGQLDEAIQQFGLYIDSAGETGPYTPQARHERFLAERALATQHETEAKNRLQSEKDQQAQATAEQLSTVTTENWLTVQSQLKAGQTTILEPLTGIELIYVKGGCFDLGDLFGDGEQDELPVHNVCIDDFYLGKTEVTQGQWQKVMGYNPSAFPKGDAYPVENISWQEAITFSRNLSGKNGRYRLPTEAEWEYAARSGGQKEKFSGGDDVDLVAWHEDNSQDSPQPVGQKQANGLGLYDMSGNVYEWCLDRYAADYYQTSPEQNPPGPLDGEERIRRGGSWDSETGYSRSSYRDARHESEYRANYTGFRLALPVSE